MVALSHKVQNMGDIFVAISACSVLLFSGK